MNEELKRKVSMVVVVSLVCGQVAPLVSSSEVREDVGQLTYSESLALSKEDASDEADSEIAETGELLTDEVKVDETESEEVLSDSVAAEEVDFEVDFVKESEKEFEKDEVAVELVFDQLTVTQTDGIVTFYWVTFVGEEWFCS